MAQSETKPKLFRLRNLQPDSEHNGTLSDLQATILRSRIPDLRSAMRANDYGLDSIAFIDRCARLSVLIHTNNEDETRRFRKFDGDPYAHHTLDMAEEAVRMHLHPTLAAACLLHDTLEDGKLGKLKTSEQWISSFDKIFWNYPDKARLLRILRAEQKTIDFSNLFKTEEDKQNTIEEYMQLPVAQTAMGYLRKLRNGLDGHDWSPSAQDKEQIAEVLFDLNRIISQSFIINEAGKQVFDPSILVVKILDVWQNLKTTGFWRTQLTDEKKDAKTVAKIVRARILTNAAEFLGMRRVASEMTENMAIVQDAGDINFDLIKSIEKEKESPQSWAQMAPENALHWQKVAVETATDAITQAIQYSEYPERNPNSVFQMPWVEDGHPGAHMLVIVPSGRKPTILKGGSYADGHIRIGERPLTFTEGGWRAAFQSALGRKTADYQLLVHSDLVESGPVNGTLRIEAVHPGAMRMVSKLRSPDINKPKYSSFAEHVPEAGIFHPEVCKYLGIALNETLLRHGADTRHMALTDFLFSPHTFMSRGSEANNATYIIIANGKMFLASNRTQYTLYSIARAAGVQKPVVRPLENQDLSVRVSPRNHHVLDDMRTANLLTNRVVVISQGENEGWGNIYSGGLDVA